MIVPQDRRYSEEHEWALALDDTHVRVGITDYAQDSLGDVVYVDLPSVGTEFAKSDTMAEVESTKSVADIYAPLAGSVSAVNDALTETPELVNTDPYGEGWFIELEVGDSSALNQMLDADRYRALTE